MGRPIKKKFFGNAKYDIAVSSYLTTGTQAITTSGSYIVKQEASHRYLVQNTEGQGQCILVSTSTLTAGTMNMIATDINSSTYFVTKLTSHRALLTRYTDSGSGFEYATGSVSGWTTATAVTGIVTIATQY